MDLQATNNALTTRRGHYFESGPAVTASQPDAPLSPLNSNIPATGPAAETVQLDDIAEALMRLRAAGVEAVIFPPVPGQRAPLGLHAPIGYTSTSTSIPVPPLSAQNTILAAFQKQGSPSRPIMDMDSRVCPIHLARERNRDKVKTFIKEKGPRIAGGAATIGMFVFNIVSNCC